MKSIVIYIYTIIKIFIPETRFFRLKRFMLRCAGVDIGKNVKICSSARFLGTGKLSIGDNTWIGPNCLIMSNASSSIIIGKNIDIAPKVFISNGSHEIDIQGEHSAGKAVTKNIIIEDGVWIGVNSTILLGVKIGHKTIVAAGTVVNKNIPDYCLAGGVPVRVIRNLK